MSDQQGVLRPIPDEGSADRAGASQFDQAVTRAVPQLRALLPISNWSAAKLKSANLLYPVALIDFDVACIRAPTVKSQVSDRHYMDFLHRVVSEVESAKDAPLVARIVECCYVAFLRHDRPERFLAQRFCQPWRNPRPKRQIAFQIRDERMDLVWIVDQYRTSELQSPWAAHAASTLQDRLRCR